jgi:predicted adenylyl cyclase CyaB
MKRNIELKARCHDLNRAKQAAMEAGARPGGVLVQTDTYFHAANGRLKLREIEGAGAELISYARGNELAFRASDYVVSPVPDAGTMRATLSSGLGVRGVVKKRRQLYLFENVRIHLDVVEGLGDFIEFEAVITTAADERVSHARLAKLTEVFSISDEDRVAVSYSDLAGI